MNKIITGACIIVVYCFSACADNDQDQDSGLMNSDSSKPATIIPDSQSFAKPAITSPGSGQATINPLAQPVVNQASLTTTAPGMNPPHGKPNHRCDIAVGAPLNSPATTPGAQAVSTPIIPALQPTITPAQKATVKTVTPAGMNPQHGEPGHRCDIAVGAPLNSPATKPPAQIAIPAAPVAAPVIAPTKKDSGI